MPCNTFQSKWKRDEKRLGKLWNAAKRLAWNISQVNGFIADDIMMGQQDKVHHFFKHRF